MLVKKKVQTGKKKSRNACKNNLNGPNGLPYLDNAAQLIES